MTAYYNEIDPYAAQWLRHAITSDRVPLASNSFGLVVDGTLGKVPKPSQAKPYWQPTGAALSAHAQADERFLSRGILRMLRSLGAHWDSAGKTADSDYPAEAFLWSGRDRSLPSADDAYGILERILHSWRACIRRSKAICCFDLGRLGSGSRNAGSYGLARQFRRHVPADTQPCISQSSTSCGSAMAALLGCTECNFGSRSSLLLSSGEGQ